MHWLLVCTDNRIVLYTNKSNPVTYNTIITDLSYLVFMVRACDTAVLTLTPVPNNFTLVYEVQIGANGNAKTYIYKKRNGNTEK